MVQKNHTGPYLSKFTYSCSARQNPLVESAGLTAWPNVLIYSRRPSITQWPGDRSKGVAQLAQSTCIVFLDHVQNLHISCSARQNPYEFFLHEYVNFVHGREKSYSSVSTKIYIFMQCASKSFCRFSVWGMILNHTLKVWFTCQLCDPCIGPLSNSVS